MKRILFPAVLAALSFVSVSQPADAFGRARPDGSFLSASLPGTPHDESGVRDTVVGDITHNTLSVTEGDTELSITATQLPGVVTTMSTDNMLYRKARNELLKNYGAKRTVWTGCRHAGHSCKKLKYKTDDGRRGMARLYMHDDTLVVANGVWDDDKKAVRKFLGSVH